MLACRNLGFSNSHYMIPGIIPSTKQGIGTEHYLMCHKLNKIDWSIGNVVAIASSYINVSFVLCYYLLGCVSPTWTQFHQFLNMCRHCAVKLLLKEDISKGRYCYTWPLFKLGIK